jgi:hypothetical protein
MPDFLVATGQRTETATFPGNARRPSANSYGDLYTAPWTWHLAQQGRVWIATDADANDAVTGQTSFADTTPTFDLEVPSGTTAIPLLVRLGQVGTVAGGAITVNMALSVNLACYASGGTSEAVYNARTDVTTGNACALWSTPTCTTARAIKNLYSTPLIGPDVSPAEGVFAEVVWTPERAGHPLYIVGPGALAVFTWAGTTGPTWAWTFAWAEVPTTTLGG